MRPIDETVKTLENIELLLKSIDYQLTRLVKELSTPQERGESAPSKPRLLSTKEASEMFGISIYELRRGYREGIYPAIEMGSSENRFRKIKWRADLLEEALGKVREE